MNSSTSILFSYLFKSTTMKNSISLIPTIKSFFILSLILFQVQLNSQCLQSGGIWPSNPIISPVDCDLDTIVINQFSDEYSIITDLMNGVTYEFAFGNSGYITIRDGSDASSSVLEHGNSPLQYTTTNSNNLYIHWYFDSACTAATTNTLTTIQQICSAPPCENPNKLFNEAITAPLCFQNLVSSSISPGYYVLDSLDSEVTYVFGMSIPGNITIRDAANPSDVVAQGSAPFSYPNSNLDSIEIHFNTGDQCSLGGTFVATFFGGCAPPCQNNTLFPTAPFLASTTNKLDTTSQSNWAGDFRKVSHLTEGNTYRFTSTKPSTGPDYITIRDHADPDNVLAYGTSPIDYIAGCIDTIQVHYNLDNNFCGVESINRTTTIQCMSCAPDLCELGVPATNLPMMGETNQNTPYMASTRDACYLFGSSSDTELAAHWFKFAVPASGSVALENDPPVETVATFYTGSCDSLYRETCNLFSSDIEVDCLPPGDTVYLLITREEASVSANEFNITDPGAPDPEGLNSSCYCAEDILLGACTSGEILYPTGGDDGIMAYYSYTHVGADAEYINISVDMLVGPELPQSARIILAKNCFNLDIDDLEVANELTFLALPGEEYIIGISLFSLNFRPTIGSFRVCLDSCTPPSNDFCAMAETIPVAQLGCDNMIPGTSKCATAGLDEFASVYYQFTPAVDSTYTIRIEAESGLGFISVLDNCDDEPVASGITSVTTCLTGEETYYLAVGAISYPEDIIPSDFNICITTALNTGSDLPNDGDCTTATRLEISTDRCEYNGIIQGYACPKPSGINNSTTFFCNGNNYDDGMGEDIWFKVKYPSDASKYLGIETFNILGETVELGIELYIGTCPGGLARSFTSCNTEGIAVMEAVGGVTRGADVFIRIFENNNDEEGTFYIRAVEVPINATCTQNSLCGDKAMPITVSATEACQDPLAGSTQNANPYGNTDYENPIAWYTYTPADDDTVVIEVSNIEIPCIDIDVPLSAMIYVSTAGGTGAPDEYSNPHTQIMTGGTEYLIGIAGSIDGEECTFPQLIELQLSFLENISIEDQIRLTGSGVDFDVCMYQAPEPDPCIGNVDCTSATVMTDGACAPGDIRVDCEEDRVAWYTYATSGTGSQLYTLSVTDIPPGMKAVIQMEERNALQNCSNSSSNSTEFRSNAITIPLLGSRLYHFRVTLHEDDQTNISSGTRQEGTFNFCLSACADAAPSNTTCASAEMLTTSSCASGSTLLCGGSIELWYEFEGPQGQSGDYNFTVENYTEGLIPILEFTSSCGFSLNRQLYNDDRFIGSGADQLIKITFMDINGSLVGSDFNLCVEQLVNCNSNNTSCNSNDIIILPVGGADPCVPILCGSSHESWFAIPGSALTTTPTDYTVSITAYSLITQDITIYEDQGAANGNGCSLPAIAGGITQATASMESGNNYYIRVIFNSVNNGGDAKKDFNICVTPCSDADVDNSTCGTAITLDVSTECCDEPLEQYYGCPDHSGVSSNCGIGPGGDLWYEAVVPASGALSLSLSDDSGMLKAAIYNGSCGGTLSQIGICTFSFGSDDELWGAAGLVPGSTVYIQVWNGFTTAYQTPFSICVWDPFPSECPEDLVLMGIVNSTSVFEASQSITSDQQISATTTYSAMDSIVLQENFQVDDNTQFEVLLDGCSTGGGSGNVRGIPTDITHLVARQMGYNIGDGVQR